MRYRRALVALLLIAFTGLLAAQTYPLSEVEVRLVHTPHDGCSGPCVQYTITVREDSTVEYKGVGLVEGMHTRTIPTDEVVALVNAFLQAQFLNALESYSNPPPTMVRKGDTIELYGAVRGIDATQTDLTLRIGDRKKTVTLYANYPAELGRLPELVERIGGPQIWLLK
jgi:hypothetical protein